MALLDVLKYAGLKPMAHRPPLSPRFWLYCAGAYVIPVIVQVVLPDDPGLYDELVWLVALAPAFLLSLHYGLKGAVAALVMGMALFITVQTVLAVYLTPDDWRVTVPIWIANGALAISVGWLSELMHSYYQRAVDNARLAAIGEVAVTIRHEVNNALTAVVAESELLVELEKGLTEQGKAAAMRINESALRVARDVRRLTEITDAPATDYLPGIKMVDLNGARV